MFHVEHSGLFACRGGERVGAKWGGRAGSGEPGRFSAWGWERVFRNGAAWGAEAGEGSEGRKVERRESGWKEKCREGREGEMGRKSEEKESGRKEKA